MINAFCALSRFSIRVHRLHKWEEMVQLETWPVGYNRLFAQRHFRFSDKNNDILIEGNTDWVVMRFDTRTMISPQLVVGHLKLGNDIPKVDFETTKLPLVNADKAILHVHKTVYSDLDMNGHVNSLKYLDWCFDCLPSKTILENRLKQIDINFQHEIPANTMVDILISKIAHQDYLFNGYLKESGQLSFAVRSQFN